MARMRVKKDETAAEFYERCILTLLNAGISYKRANKIYRDIYESYEIKKLRREHRRGWE